MQAYIYARRRRNRKDRRLAIVYNICIGDSSITILAQLVSDIRKKTIAGNIAVCPSNYINKNNIFLFTYMFCIFELSIFE